MRITASSVVLRRTERWFIRQGTPTMIEGYGVIRNVLPRMLPAMSFVSMASLAWLVPLEAGSLQWVLLGAVLVATLTVWTTIRVFVRRLRRFPPSAAGALLTGFAVIVVVTPQVQLAVEDPVTPVSSYVTGFLASAALFTVVFGIALVATTYGFGELIRRAIGRAVHDLRNSPHVLGRALPPMLFVTLFLFFTSELWQVMNRLSWWRVALFVALFVGVTVLAAAGRLHEEIGRVEQDLTPSLLSSACRGTPLEVVDIGELTHRC